MAFYAVDNEYGEPYIFTDEQVRAEANRIYNRYQPLKTLEARKAHLDALPGLNHRDAALERLALSRVIDQRKRQRAMMNRSFH